MSQNGESLSQLKQCFSEIEDPRINRRKRHSLLNVVLIALYAVICGERGWENIAESPRQIPQQSPFIRDLNDFALSGRANIQRQNALICDSHAIMPEAIRNAKRQLF